MITPRAKTVRPLTNKDVEEARELRATGVKWREIGKRLAKRKGRATPYQGPSIQMAVWRVRKAESSNS